MPFRQFGWMELLIVLAIALLIFGPSKLPQLGRAIGRTIRQFRKSISGEEPEEAGEREAGEEDEAGADG